MKSLGHAFAAGIDCYAVSWRWLAVSIHFNIIFFVLSLVVFWESLMVVFECYTGASYVSSLALPYGGEWSAEV